MAVTPEAVYVTDSFMPQVLVVPLGEDGSLAAPGDAFSVPIGGELEYGEGFNLNVLFVHPGGLSPGAPVKIAGGEVGHVEEMTYLGLEGPLRPSPEGSSEPPARTRVKVVIWVEERVRSSIRQDGTYYVTMEGILAEPMIEQKIDK